MSRGESKVKRRREFGLFGGEKMRIAWWCDMRPHLALFWRPPWLPATWVLNLPTIFVQSNKTIQTSFKRHKQGNFNIILASFLCWRSCWLCSLGGVDKAKTSEEEKLFLFRHTAQGLAEKSFLSSAGSAISPFYAPQKNHANTSVPKNSFLVFVCCCVPKAEKGGKGFFANEFLEAKKSCFSTKRPWWREEKVFMTLQRGRKEKYALSLSGLANNVSSQHKSHIKLNIYKGKQHDFKSF